MSRPVTAPTLTEFILARIEDDKRWAQMAGHGFGHQPIGAPRNAGWVDIDTTDNVRASYDAGFITRMSPRRVFAECEAKRRIVKEAAMHETCGGGYDECSELAQVTLLALAAVHAEHSDYRQEWRP